MINYPLSVARVWSNLFANRPITILLSIFILLALLLTYLISTLEPSFFFIIILTLAALITFSFLPELGISLLLNEGVQSLLFTKMPALSGFRYLILTLFVGLGIIFHFLLKKNTVPQDFTARVRGCFPQSLYLVLIFGGLLFIGLLRFPSHIVEYLHNPFEFAVATEDSVAYAFEKSFQFLFRIILPCLFLLFFIKEPKRLKRFSYFLIFSLIVYFLSGYLEIFKKGIGLVISEQQISYRLGFDLNPIRYARAAGIVILFLVIFFTYKKSYFLKILFSCLLLLITFLFFASGSRGPAVALSFTFLIFLLRELNLFKKILYVEIIGLITLALFSFLPTPTLERLTTFSADFPTIKSRIEAIQSAWRLFTESPLIGAGTGAAFDYYTHHPHNIILEIGAELGILGLITFGLFLFFSFATLTKILKKTKGTSFYPWAVFWNYVFIFCLIDHLFAADITGVPLLWFAPIYLAIWYKASEIGVRSSEFGNRKSEIKERDENSNG